MDPQLATLNIWNLLATTVAFLLYCGFAYWEFDIWSAVGHLKKEDIDGCDEHTIQNLVYASGCLDTIAACIIVLRVIMGCTYFSQFEELSDRTKRRMDLVYWIQHIARILINIFLFLLFVITAGHFWNGACSFRDSIFFDWIQLYLILNAVRSGLALIISTFSLGIELCLISMERSGNNGNVRLAVAANAVTDRLQEEGIV